MSDRPVTSDRRLTWLAVAAAAVALLFALYTNHTWEDYYITYRSSKNLATGHGLVFNHGDRLHTFTSPLGVLLPAVASLLTGNTSDAGALWLFRLMCVAAFGGAVLLLGRTAGRLHGAAAAGLWLGAWLLADAKSVDFTINGMETAFMLLFLAYALRSHTAPGPRQALHLGAAWAGLMWTRPDSFIYIGLLAAGCWLFHRPAGEEDGRLRLLRTYLRAGLVTTALYLPWLLWAWWYYGTPVPHTITAKSGVGPPHSLGGLLLTVVELPYLAWAKFSSLELTFLPSYVMIGGWPQALIIAARVLATACSLLWLLPVLRPWGRAASFAFFGAHVYLTYFPYFPFPWYLPSTTLLALVALADLFHWAASRPAGPAPRIAAVLAAVLLAGQAWCLVQVARQVRLQQTVVEDGTRRKIGEWLRAHARPTDTVFMEPLGYIGYFSGLKTYDWPGMSSREMVVIREISGNSWGRIISLLQPGWIVLRPFEAESVEKDAPGLIARWYEKVQDFDSTPALREADVPGLPYLRHDAHFSVYRLAAPMKFATELVQAHSQFAVSQEVIDGIGVLLVHAPGEMIIKVPLRAETVTGQYGFTRGAWEGEPHTDGAEYVVELHDRGTVRELFRARLDPAGVPAHRPLQPYEIPLPAGRSADARLHYRTLPGATTTKDWTSWSFPIFR